jgi:hypothetical protein
MSDCPAMIWIVSLGVIAMGWTTMLWAPLAREISIKLATLLEWARRENPALYAAKLEPITPFLGQRFKANKVNGILKADFSEFGDVCQRLQREARRLDVKAHYAMVPFGVYLVGLAVWYFAVR